MPCVICGHPDVKGNAYVSALEEMALAAGAFHCVDCSRSIANDDHFWQADSETYLCCACKGKRVTHTQN